MDRYPLQAGSTLKQRLFPCCRFEQYSIVIGRIKMPNSNPTRLHVVSELYSVLHAKNAAQGNYVIVKVYGSFRKFFEMVFK